MRLSFYHYSLEWMKNEVTSDTGFILFVSRWTQLSFYHYKPEWIKSETSRFFPFRFEINATIRLSRLAWMNEERSYKRQGFHPFRFEMNANILLSLLTRMNEERSDTISSILCRDKPTIFRSLLRRKNEEWCYNFLSFSFRDERDYPSFATNVNEWRTKLQSFILFVSRIARLSFYHY
jgi:hypothetical protein